MKFKDSIITANSKQKEFRILLALFILAFLLNLYGIIRYGSPAIELLSELHIVLLVTLVLYGLTGILRLLYHLVSRLWKRTS